MKKKIILRGIFGIPLGITIAHLITVFMSLKLANGHYSPCVPELISAMGNEINAVLLQTVLSGVLGAGIGAGSAVWDIDRWSLAKRTGIYYLFVSAIMLPIAYFLYWMNHSIKGILIYLWIFTFTFITIWVTQFLIEKQNVKKMNRGLNKAKNKNSDSD